MKKINRKKLNNKGFTLIELLAVVVILAVVMGIATTSVLSAMNKSRGGSLEDSAMIIANAFNQKYTESLVDGVASDVYGAYDVLGTGNGYDFTANASYFLKSSLADTFGISTDTFDLDESGTLDTTTGVKSSFVSFDASTGKFTVCLFAKNGGSYYVAGFKEDALTSIGSTGVAAQADTMYACSDGTRSW